MTRIVWGTTGERYFETGADRGVLYLPGQDGVPWSGITSVNEAPDGGDPQPYYIDGYKYANVSSAEDFKATLSALSAPKEFGVCDGTAPIHNGLFATQQPRKSFGLSYRTLVGNDISGVDHGYKIHLVYNALAAPSTRDNATINGSVSPLGLSWSISTTPPKITGLRPTAHFVVDTRYTNSVTLALLENILYGYASGAPRLPDVDELVALFGWNPPDVGVPLNFLGYSAATIKTITNLVANPDLETNSTGWSIVNSTSALDATDKHSGNQSLKVTTNGTGLAEGIVYLRNLTGMPNQPFTAGVWVKAPVGAKLYLVMRTQGAVSSDSPQSQFTGTGDWQFIMATKVAQADATSYQVQVRTNTSIQAVAFNIDDIIVVQDSVLDILPFNGSTQNLVVKNQRVYPAWQGVANASQSALDYIEELDRVGNAGDAYIINGSLWVFLPDGYWQNYGGLPSI